MQIDFSGHIYRVGKARHRDHIHQVFLIEGASHILFIHHCSKVESIGFALSHRDRYRSVSIQITSMGFLDIVGVDIIDEQSAHIGFFIGAFLIGPVIHILQLCVSGGFRGEQQIPSFTARPGSIEIGAVHSDKGVVHDPSLINLLRRAGQILIKLDRDSPVADYNIRLAGIFHGSGPA